MQVDSIHSIRDGLLNREQLAAEFGVSTRTIDRWQVGRVGPPRIKVGNRIFFRREAVLAWLAAREERVGARRDRRRARERKVEKGAPRVQEQKVIRPGGS